MTGTSPAALFKSPLLFQKRMFYVSLILFNTVSREIVLNATKIPPGVHIYLGRLTGAWDFPITLIYIFGPFPTKNCQII